MQTKELIKDVAASVIAAFIVSVIGGGVSVYLTFNILVSRVERLESRTTAIEDANRELTEKLGDIKADVSYIRGRMEPKGN